MLFQRCKFTTPLKNAFTKIMIKRFSHSERKVRVNGYDINIVESGQGSESILLLPGALGSSWTDFKPQIEQLPSLLPNHTLIAWDPPGYGKSIPPKRQFGLNFFHNDACCALDLMKELNRPKFSVMCWSNGGVTGLILAGRFVENVHKLIVWGAGAQLTANEVKAMKNIRDVNKLSARMREPMEKVYGVERCAKLWSEWVDAYVLFYSERNGDFCTKEVDQIKAPTFILHGKKDPMLAAEHVPYLREHIIGAKYYEFPEGKHNIHLRYAEEFNRKVADFILDK